MLNNNVEKGDIVVIRDAQTGETKSVTVISVKADYENPNTFLRFDYINHNEPSPMRRTAWPKELVQIVKKNTMPKVDPKAQRPGDLSAPAKKEIFIDGKRYVEVKPQDNVQVPLNDQANTQVHEAVTAPAKPVTSRLKKAPVVTK